MRRGVRIPAWYLLLVAVLGILSGCQSLRVLERFARRHHGALTKSLGLELRRPPSDSAFIAQVTLYSAALGVAISQACYATGENHERAVLRQLLGELDLEGVLIQEQGADFLLTVKGNQKHCIARSDASSRGNATPLEWQRTMRSATAEPSPG